ncbi:MAG: ABC transporter substrate-binding protein, partial [Acetobacteraceae bacterium]
EWGKSNHDPAVAELKSKYNLDPVLDLSMARGSADSTPQVLKLRAAAPDVIIAILYPAELAIFERDAYKYGLHVAVIGNQAISIEDTRNRAGGLPVVRNLYVYYPLAAPADDPSMAKWKAISEKYFPDMRVETGSMLGMGGAVAMVDALKRAGRNLTGQKLIDALNQTHELDTGVLGSPISFTPEDHAGVKGGQFITYEGDKLALVKQLQPK